MRHHHRLIYRYDIEGSQALGLITVQRNRFTNRFKTATYQHKYMRKPTRLSLAEYLSVSRMSSSSSAVRYLADVRGVYWSDLPDSNPSPDAPRDHSFAWLVGSLVFVVVAWSGAGAAFAYVIVKAVS